MIKREGFNNVISLIIYVDSGEWFYVLNHHNKGLLDPYYYNQI